MAVPAGAQSTDPAPYLHTTRHRTGKHIPKKAAVPVVAPRHAGAPRRAPRPAAKPPPPKPVAQAAPKKPAPPPLPANIGPNTGLPLPRYAALKSDDVNMRAGPGERYPVLWTYQRRDLPVRIEREFDIWRQVEDMDGIKGWMHEATLTGHREFVVIGTADVNLRAQANDTSDAVALLKPGVIGRLRACDMASGWCQVQVQSYQGFVKRSDVWGVLEGEVIGP